MRIPKSLLHALKNLIFGSFGVNLDYVNIYVEVSNGTKEYNLGVCDCVNFAADACRAVGISVPRVNITPGGFVSWLKTFKSDYTHYNQKPYPWKVRPASPYAPAVADRGKYVATVIVERGMTLGELCKQIYPNAKGAKLWERVNTVAKANLITNPNLIRVGQKINFPKV